MKSIIWKSLLTIVVLIAITIYFIYNKPHRNILEEEATYSISLAEMNEEFVLNEQDAFDKYFNKVVEIEGIATSINEKAEGRYDIVIESNGIYANGEIIEATINPEDFLQQKVALKGLFIGYDNLLEEIKVSECSVKLMETINQLDK